LKKCAVKGVPTSDIRVCHVDRSLWNVVAPDVAFARRQTRIEQRRMSDLNALDAFAS
jgi:hypothetical protein